MRYRKNIYLNFMSLYDDSTLSYYVDHSTRKRLRVLVWAEFEFERSYMTFISKNAIVSFDEIFI